jgi:hypothetical protein
MDEEFERNANLKLNKIREIAELLHIVYNQRLYTNGNVRDGYTQVLRNEMYRMMREVDDFKVWVCEHLVDVDAEAVMNVARFPNMARQGNN